MKLCQGLGGAWVVGLVTGCGGALAAQPGIGDAPRCAEVTVNGVRAPSFECLTLKLQPRAQLQIPGDAPQPGLASEGIVLRPSNQLGLFNHAATSTRMGNTFGTSVYPQRPPLGLWPLPVGAKP